MAGSRRHGGALLGEESWKSLHHAYHRWLLDPDEGGPDWIAYVLEDLLGWADAVPLTEDLSTLSHEDLEHCAVITPSCGLHLNGSR
jgi:hypothetical protein